MGVEISSISHMGNENIIYKTYKQIKCNLSHIETSSIRHMNTESLICGQIIIVTKITWTTTKIRLWKSNETDIEDFEVPEESHDSHEIIKKNFLR